MTLETVEMTLETVEMTWETVEMTVPPCHFEGTK